MAEVDAFKEVALVCVAVARNVALLEIDAESRSRAAAKFRNARARAVVG